MGGQWERGEWRVDGRGGSGGLMGEEGVEG